MAEQIDKILVVAPCVLEPLHASKLAPVNSRGTDDVLGAENDAQKDKLAQDMVFNPNNT